MLMEKFEAKIKQVVSKRFNKDNVTDEYHHLTLVYEYNQRLAKGMNLGELGIIVQQSLAEGALLQAKLPVPVEGLTAEFIAGDESYTIRGIKALSANAKRPNAEDPNPTLSLEMHLAWQDDEGLLFFNNHLTETIEVILDKEQQSLPGVD